MLTQPEVLVGGSFMALGVLVLCRAFCGRYRPFESVNQRMDKLLPPQQRRKT